MAVKLESSLDLAVAHGVKVLVYSKAGIGKTVLSATAPAPLMLSAESGLLSVSRNNLERLYGKDNPDICYEFPVIQIDSLDKLTEAYDWLLLSAEANQFQTVCLDSISEIAEKILANAKLQVKDQRQAYTELQDKMWMTIRKFRDMKGKHVYFAAKQEFTTDTATGAKSYMASFPGNKLSQGASYFFDEVFNLGVGKTIAGDEYRYLLTQPDLQYDAKDRSGCLDKIEEPNLTRIFNKIIANCSQ
jgi:hypothetical protein